MKKNIYTLRKIITICLALFGLTLTSCKDKDEEKPSDDPRIMNLILSDYSNYEFVVNDYEGIIFNIDSLPYGTRTDSLYLYIYGYGDELPIHVGQEGSNLLTPYSGSTPLNLNKATTFVTTSEDGKHNKTYTIDLRVHKYDIDAFDWRNIATFDISGKIVSEKSIIIGDKYCWFVRNSENALYSSTNGNNWTKNILPITTSEGDSIDFSNLVLYNDTLYTTTTDGKVLKSGAKDLTAISFEAGNIGNYGKVDRILFTTNETLWFAEDTQFGAYKNGKIAIKETNSKINFANKDIVAFTAMSGLSSLGYVYIPSSEGSQLWAIDKYGNIENITSNALPTRFSPLVFCYGETIGIIGGYDAKGKLSGECFCSQNSGITWQSDWHKDLSEQVGALTKAGLFITSNKGEMLITGGENETSTMTKVWCGKLKKIQQQEDFLETIK